MTCTNNNFDPAFLAIHDLSLAAADAESPQDVLKAASAAVASVLPEVQIHFWWTEGDTYDLISPPGEGIAGSLPNRAPEHLCLIHSGDYIRPSFFDLPAESNLVFFPISDRSVVYGWGGIERTTAKIDDKLPFLCSVGSILGSAWTSRIQKLAEIDNAQRISRLSRYLSPKLAQAVTDDELEERCVDSASVPFLDLRSFTNRIYSQPHMEILRELNQFYTSAIETVFDHGGVVDKLLGDGLVAEFGILSSEPKDHQARAVKAAKTLVYRTREFNRRCMPRLKYKINIGIATGSLHVGHVGSDAFFDLTVIGKTVNLAARLEGVAANLSVDVAVDQATYEACLDEGWCAFPGQQIKGAPEPVDVWGLNVE